jgi:hypothetical protein
LGLVAHVCNSSTGEAEEGGLWDWNQSLYNKNLSEKNFVAVFFFFEKKFFKNKSFQRRKTTHRLLMLMPQSYRFLSGLNIKISNMVVRYLVVTLGVRGVAQCWSMLWVCMRTWAWTLACTRARTHTHTHTHTHRNYQTLSYFTSVLLLITSIAG